MANGQMGVVDTVRNRLLELKSAPESDISRAQKTLESARKSGRVVPAQEMTPTMQTAQKRLLAKDQSKSNGNGRAFATAQSEYDRKKQGIGGKYMVK